MPRVLVVIILLGLSLSHFFQSTTHLLEHVSNKGKKVKFSHTRWARSWSRCTGSQPASDFYSAAALHAMQSAVIPTAIPSVCPSVTRWYPIQTNEHRITRSSLWGSKNILVFWYQQWLGGDDPFHLKFALKVTHPLWNAPSSTNICL